MFFETTTPAGTRFLACAVFMGSGKQATRSRVLQLHAAGLSAGHIHHRLKQESRGSGQKVVGKRTISRWVRAIESGASKFVSGPRHSTLGNAKANRKGAGKLSLADKRRALDHLESHGSLRGTARSVKKLGITISRSTLSRSAKKAKFKKKRPDRKPNLTRLLKQTRNRVATNKLDFPWPIAAFADFKTFVIGGGHNVQNEVVWRGPRSKRPVPNQPKPKFPAAVKYFGCITSKGGLPLIEVEEKLDSQGAQTLCLEPTLPKLRSLMGTETMLWLDHDPLWSSEDTQQYLQDNSDGWFPPSETPARSPDMSLIESVWGEMSTMVHDENPVNKAQLRWAVQKAWTACTTQPKLDKLYASMPRRMQAVIDAKGGWTDY